MVVIFLTINCQLTQSNLEESVFILFTMRLLHIAKDVIPGFVKSFSKPLWVEILTSNPHCIYYFGSFPNRAEAEAACPGYIEDLENEGSQVLKVIIKPCQPKMLTRCEEEVF